jgi:diaminohydroxyphosphoribosylaminopyrimidine deaminase/5-amino-6-(5-phosphoribosylamino)uracil reductase
MRRALKLAEMGSGLVSPNPLVGAVIVGDHGERLGEGFHRGPGTAHAEVAALENAREAGHDPAGATLFVTLEPCCHVGRTGPCTEALIAAGITRVVSAAGDPTAKVAGRGYAALIAAGIDVQQVDGAEAAAARRQNQPFRIHATLGRPMVLLKQAMTLDGRVTVPGRRWLSDDQSRSLVHMWRAQVDGVAVGSGTALADDPQLTSRGPNPVHRQPRRVVFDRRLRTPPTARMLGLDDGAETLVVTDPDAEPGARAALESAGATILEADSLETGLRLLGDRGLQSLLLEGGPTLAAAFSDAGLVDRVATFITPLAGPDPVENWFWQEVGHDMLVSGAVREV